MRSSNGGLAYGASDNPQTHIIQEGCERIYEFNTQCGTQKYRSEPYRLTPHSVVLGLPSGHSSCTQFSAPQRNACRRVTRRRASSAPGTKAGTTSKTHFKLRALSFCFIPMGALNSLFGFNNAENARFETQPPSFVRATSCNYK